MVKRCLDISVSAVLLLLALPLLVLAAFLIRMSSPGPALFRQQRMGRGFVPFEILKLRTMAHAESGLSYTLGADRRITPIGAWLRRYKVDELPQLWNVLRGEMSLVGPRPVIVELALEFRAHYQLLLRARPGLTDPASLKYSQETRLLAASPDPLRFFKTVLTPDKIRMSLEYMESATFWSDLSVMSLTGLACCFPAVGQVFGRMPATALTFGALRPDLAAEELRTAEVLPVFAVREEAARPMATEPVGARAGGFDGAIFASPWVKAETAREDRHGRGSMPWNPLQNLKYGGQSSPEAASEEVSSL